MLNAFVGVLLSLSSQPQPGPAAPKPDQPAPAAPANPAVPATAAKPSTDRPSADRLARLAKGVNLAHWYWLPLNGDKGFADPAYLTKDDAAKLRAAGITHVRLPIDPGRIFTESAGKPNRATLKKLTETIDMFLSADIAVVVDIHALGTANEKNYDKYLFDPTKPLAQKLEKAWLANWGALAEQLASKDPERVFLEVLNEPVFEKAEPRWTELQGKLIESIRTSAPRHTIIASGTQWGSIAGLLELKPVADANVVYSFHFYEPHTFTHQGATWGSDNWKFLKDIPYPATAELVKPLLATFEDPAVRGEVKWYSEQNWNAAKVDKLIGRAAEWAKANKTAVYCGEFGVITKAPAASRAAYLRDVRSACEKHGIGWCMWDYAGSFALMQGEKSARTTDPAVVEALGLKP